MVESCKHYLVEPNCLLRRLAEGNVDLAANVSCCEQCETTLAQLELAPDLLRRVAGELNSASVAAEIGFQRAAELAKQVRSVDAGAGAVEGQTAGLQIRCPSCGSRVSLPDHSTLGEAQCDTCGESVQLVSDGSEASPMETNSIGRFELQEQVGIGSFGVVWRAYDPELDRTVAVKIPRRWQLTSREIEKFVEEARASAALKHPNIVSVFEIGREGDRVFIVSDFIEGETLGDLLQDRILSAREAASLCATIADALHHAHEHGVVHRDLKPGNMAIVTDEAQGTFELTPYIMDFGLALRGSPEATMTSDGKILGTPAYMSPEQARGDGNQADRRSDIYSLGVVLFQMLTGERPFRGNIRMLLQQIEHDDAPNPQKLNSAIPSDLATICLKCLEKSPERRYQTAAELNEDFDRFLAGLAIEARPISPLERCWRWCLRNPLPTMLASLLLISMAAGTGISTWQWRKALSAAESERLSATRANGVLSIVTQSFESATPEQGADADMKARDLLIRARQILSESDLDHLGKARLLSSLNTCFVGVGEYESAIEAGEQELQLRRKAVAPTNSENSGLLLGAMNGLSVAYRKGGQLDKSLALCEEAYEFAQKHRSSQDRRLLDAKFSLAQTLAAMDSLERAIQLHEEVYEIELSLDAQSIATHSSANALASTYRLTGRNEEALELLEQTYQTMRKARGDEDSYVLSNLNDIAETLEALGQVDRAIEINEKLLETRRRKLGDDHPDSITTMNNLAFAYQSDGRLDEAIELFEITLASSRAKLGEKHPSTMTLVNNLAMTYWRAKRLDRSIPMFEEVVAHLEEQMGRDHIYTQTTIANLGVNYRDAEQFDKAIEYLLEAHESSRHEPQLEWVTESLRGAYQRAERFEEFDAIIKEELQRAAGRFEPNSMEHIEVVASVARSLLGVERYDESLVHLNQALELASDLPADHWQVCHLRLLKGGVLLGQGRTAEAKTLIESARRDLHAVGDQIPGYNRAKFLSDGDEWLKELADKPAGD